MKCFRDGRKKCDIFIKTPDWTDQWLKAICGNCPKIWGEKTAYQLESIDKEEREKREHFIAENYAVPDKVEYTVPSKPETEKILRLRSEGKTFRQISKLTNTSIGQVGKVLMDSGIIQQERLINFKKRLIGNKVPWDNDFYDKLSKASMVIQNIIVDLLENFDNLDKKKKAIIKIEFLNPKEVTSEDYDLLVDAAVESGCKEKLHYHFKYLQKKHITETQPIPKKIAEEMEAFDIYVPNPFDDLLDKALLRLYEGIIKT